MLDEMLKELGIIQQLFFHDLKICIHMVNYIELKKLSSFHVISSVFDVFSVLNLAMLSICHGAHYTNLQNYWSGLLKVSSKMCLDPALLSKGKIKILLYGKKWVCCMPWTILFFLFGWSPRNVPFPLNALFLSLIIDILILS